MSKKYLDDVGTGILVENMKAYVDEEIEAIAVPFSGATSSEDGEQGFVLAPSAGDQDKFLKGDGTWTTMTHPQEILWIDILYDSTNQTYCHAFNNNSHQYVGSNYNQFISDEYLTEYPTYEICYMNCTFAQTEEEIREILEQLNDGTATVGIRLLDSSNNDSIRLEQITKSNLIFYPIQTNGYFYMGQICTFFPNYDADDNFESKFSYSEICFNSYLDWIKLKRFVTKNITALLGRQDTMFGDISNLDTESQNIIGAINELNAAIPSTETYDTHVSNTAIHVTSEEKETWNSKSDFSGNYDDLTDKPFYDESVPISLEILGWYPLVDSVYYTQICLSDEIKEGAQVNFTIDGNTYDITAEYNEELGTIVGGDIEALVVDNIDSFTFGWMLVPADGGCPYILAVYIKSETEPSEYSGAIIQQTLKKLDEKFLPSDYVETINGTAPDESGNIDLSYVKTINGAEPDENENIDLSYVKTINGEESDEDGNIDLSYIKSVNGQTPVGTSKNVKLSLYDLGARKIEIKNSDGTFYVSEGSFVAIKPSNDTDHMKEAIIRLSSLGIQPIGIEDATLNDIVYLPFIGYEDDITELDTTPERQTYMFSGTYDKYVITVAVLSDDTVKVNVEEILSVSDINDLIDTKLGVIENGSY